MSELSYKNAGVDLDQYQESMRRLPKLMRRTHSSQVLPWADGFAGLFQLNQAGATYRDPVMVSGTDGVGTKLKVAMLAGMHVTVGIDLVAMCVNDVLCAGATPLFFLDYVAMGKDDSDLLEQIVQGVSDGCVESGSALLGGETAIMPDLYQPGDYDLAGFSVGVAERDQLIDGSKIKPGDRAIGIASSGFHSNGYSLIRKVVFAHAGLGLDHRIDETGLTVSETLLKPTRIYAKQLAQIPADVRAQAIHGLAHITGGGLAENIERILPTNVDLQIDRASWKIPAEFQWLQKLGDIKEAEMFRVFNMGIGFVIITAADAADQIMQQLSPSVECCLLGNVTSGTGKVTGVPHAD
jgi:phosphoribosylformylglycinamidine cyclo-ligase